MRPLTLSELAEASIIDPKSSPSFDKDRRHFSPVDVLDFLPGLVTVVCSKDSDSSTSLNEENDSMKTGEERYSIRLAHFSVKEYLVSDRMRASQYSIKEIPANISIAETCLAYLLQFDKPDSSTSRTLEELPLVGYAAKYWTQHARWAGEDAIAIHLLIMEFFLSKRDAYVNWVRLSDPDKPWSKPNITKDSKRVASPLYYASLTGLIESVRRLLEKGAGVNAQGGRLGNALQAASAGGYDQIVQRLLEKGADVNAQGGGYGSALYAASAGGYDQIVQRLLEKGARFMYSTPRNGTTGV
jgi:Ankyrin repeats (3 copies)